MTEIVTWMHQERGGYGYITPVDAEIVKRLPSGRVKIRVALRDGSKVIRMVKPESLRMNQQDS